MFERYTEAARRALFFARYETSQLGSTSIEAEHLLLGLVREPTGIVAAVLGAAGVTAAQLRAEVEQKVESGPKLPTSVEIPFSESCKRALQFAAAEADALGHGYIGTEHLLLGLLREGEALAWRILTTRGMDLASARRKVSEFTDGAPADKPERIEAMRLISDTLMLLDELVEEAPTPRTKEIAGEVRRALDLLTQLLQRL